MSNNWKSNGRYVFCAVTDRNIAQTTELKMSSLPKQAIEYEQACQYAKLIAAAPDMLDALKAVAADDGCPHELAEIVLAAIAKAERE